MIFRVNYDLVSVEEVHSLQILVVQNVQNGDARMDAVCVRVYLSWGQLSGVVKILGNEVERNEVIDNAMYRKKISQSLKPLPVFTS